MIEKGMRLAEIPKRYQDASFESFATGQRSPSVQAAHRIVGQYAREWLPNTANDGLILHGPVGTGKTHLAVAVLRQLIESRGVRGVFVDFRDLLKAVQGSYGPNATATEAQILRPVLEYDVVVLDELGAMRSTEWVADCIERILGERYNHDRTTIITTNYALRGPGTIHAVDGGPLSYAQAAAGGARQETLGDRIGARMFSRLQEMCRAVQVEGTDYRARQYGGR